MNLLGMMLGLRVAIVPHWNNAEGATHDTSRCFIGDVKLRELERSLPAGVAVLGIDEHTALSIDFATETIAVHGKGAVTIRIPGSGETALHSGASESITSFLARFPDASATHPATALPSPEVVLDATPAAPSARDLIAPAVDRLIALRAAARAEKRYTDADAIRDAIEALGVELVDQADGVSWSVRS
jgi:hypothetical protein